MVRFSTDAESEMKSIPHAAAYFTASAISRRAASFHQSRQGLISLKRKNLCPKTKVFLVEHRGVSSRASTALGQPGSDVPLARHSFPGRFSSPMPSWHKNKTPKQVSHFYGGA